MLEDLCEPCLPDQAVRACVSAYLDCLKGANVVPEPLIKARTRVHLAAVHPLGRTLRDAARANRISWDAAPFTALKAFLQSAQE